MMCSTGGFVKTFYLPETIFLFSALFGSTLPANAPLLCISPGQKADKQTRLTTKVAESA
ncbi:hypothetical protein ACT6QG_15455 [Xanthobacter sp. TB0136]